jgi:hypothetical protein
VYPHVIIAAFSSQVIKIKQDCAIGSSTSDSVCVRERLRAFHLSA